MSTGQRVPAVPCRTCGEPVDERDRFCEGRGRPAAAPGGAARRLLRAALDAGGHDNVTVAVLPFTPPGPSRERGR